MKKIPFKSPEEEKEKEYIEAYKRLLNKKAKLLENLPQPTQIETCPNCGMPYFDCVCVDQCGGNS